MRQWKDFESRSTEELISVFQDRAKDESHRELAFFALVHRFRQDLIQKCDIFCKRFGHGPNVAEAISGNTFTAYAKKGSFEPSKGKGKTLDDSFKIYLYGIARNELTNFFRVEEKKAKGLYYDGTEKVVSELPPVNVMELDQEDKLRYEIIQSLPKIHKAIYLTYKLYEREGCNLPKKLRLELREYCGGISQNTVRTYKKEAADKLEEGIRIMKMTLNSKS